MLYPDSGSPFEDAAILRNTIYFSTAQRAHSAGLILGQPMGVNQQTLAFLVLRAFEEFMTSTEDVLGWLFALHEWRPGDAEFSLFLLMDRIQVGKRASKGDYTEARACTLLRECDVEKFRKLIHIPTEQEMLDAGVPDESIQKIRGGLQAKLNGWRKMAELRAEQDRGWVRAFNKVKHHLLAFRTRERGKDEIWIPTQIRLDRQRRRIDLGRAWRGVTANEVRRLAGDAIAAQAVLHDTLALILTTRYNETYQPPEWVLRAYGTDYFWQM